MLETSPWRSVLACAAPLAASVVLACSSSAPAASDPCATTLGPPGGPYDLVLQGTGQCARSVALALRVATGDPAAPVWSDAASAPLRVEGSWTLAGSDAVRTVRVTNSGAAEVRLVGLEWSGVEAARGFDRLLHAGYQSWSYTGVEAIPDAHVDQLGTAPHGGDGEDVLTEIAGVSWSYAALSDATGEGLVAGADGATVLKTYLAADRTRLRIVQGVTGDALRLAPGESVALDGLFVSLGPVSAGLERYAARVAAVHPPAVPRRAPLAGWGSWNVYYDKPTADLLRQEMSWARDHLAPVGFRDFLLDDGYEAHWGAWTAKSSFGADLAALGAEQAALGLAPAIWVAPFYVDVTDAVVAQHPEWFVHRGDGTLRTFSNLGGGTYGALDVTEPLARAFVLQQLQAIRGWGYRTFKLDFLFGGAVEGVRRQPITGLQSYALWMKAIREALPDAHLVGCGAPQLASVGWVDSMRTGADIAFALAPEPTFSFMASQARSTAMRAVTDAWWAIDPDVVLLRGERISDAEAWSAVVSAAMSGGNHLLGDARQAGDLRLAMALDASVLEMTHDGVAARPRDLMDGVDPALYPSPLLIGSGETAVPHVWQKSRNGTVRWIAVFGWQSDPQFSTDLDLPEGSVEIVPPAAPGPATLRPIAGHVRIAVDGHATRLFRTAP
jgi:alpha-galactosidase